MGLLLHDSLYEEATSKIVPNITKQRRVIVVSRFVCQFVGLSARTVAAVDTKRGYVGMCNGRSAQQESGTS